MTTGIATKLWEGVQEDFGRPARLVRLLSSGEIGLPPIPPAEPSADGNTVVPWHEWLADPRSIMGWSLESAAYYVSGVWPFEARPIGAVVKAPANVTVKITNVEMLTASRSTLASFRDLDEMVSTNRAELITPISKAQLDACLAPPQTANLFKNDAHLIVHAWDGRLILSNSGGSHHFAAARYLARVLGEPVTITAPLTECRLDIPATNLLNSLYGVFVIDSRPESTNAFHDCMKAFEAPYFHTDLPRPVTGLQAVFLPRKHRRAKTVIETLQAAGAADLGSHLVRLASQQFNGAHRAIIS
jgi:hypothetical protein